MNVEEFVARWRESGGAEEANSQPFHTDLCDVLGVPRPDQTTKIAAKDVYAFERPVKELGPAGEASRSIDLYKEGCFVLEAKQGGWKGKTNQGTAWRDTNGWNVAMDAARGQALGYAGLVPVRPPFILVSDVGYCIDVYASFDGQQAESRASKRLRAGGRCRRPAALGVGAPITDNDRGRASLSKGRAARRRP